jgi:hypothetical protein
MTFVYTRISMLLWKTSHMGHGDNLLRISSNGSTAIRMSKLHRNGGRADAPCTRSLCGGKTQAFGYTAAEVTIEEELSPNSEEMPSRPGSVVSKQSSNPLQASQPQQNGSTKSSTAKKTQRPSNPFVARRKVIRLLIAVVVSFALCVLPHHIRLLVHVWFSTSQTHTDKFMVPVTFLIFYFNSCLNPFLYAFLSDNFRKAFREIVWFRCLRNPIRKGSALYTSNRSAPYTVPTVAPKGDKVSNC